eukprot:2765602-Rhodomonas_salina.1
MADHTSASLHAVGCQTPEELAFLDENQITNCGLTPQNERELLNMRSVQLNKASKPMDQLRKDLSVEDDLDLMYWEEVDIDSCRHLTLTDKINLKRLRSKLLVKNNITGQDSEDRRVGILELLGRKSSREKIQEMVDTTKQQFQEFTRIQSEAENQQQRSALQESVKTSLSKLLARLGQGARPNPEEINESNVDEIIKQLKGPLALAEDELDKVIPAESVPVRDLVTQNLKLLCGLVLARDKCSRASPNALKIKKGINCEKDLLSNCGVHSSTEHGAWMSSKSITRLKRELKETGSSWSWKTRFESGGVLNSSAPLVGAGVIAVSMCGALSDAKEAAKNDEHITSSTEFEMSREFRVYKPMAVFDVCLGTQVDLTGELVGELQTLISRIIKETLSGADVPEIARITPERVSFQLWHIVEEVYSSQKQVITEVLNKYGTHVRTRVELGGVLTNEVTVTIKRRRGDSTSVEACIKAARQAVSNAGGYAGLPNTFKADCAYENENAGNDGHREERGKSENESGVTSKITNLGGSELNKEFPALWRQSLLNNCSWQPVRVLETRALWEKEFMNLIPAPETEDGEGWETARKLLSCAMELVWVREFMEHPEGKSAEELQGAVQRELKKLHVEGKEKLDRAQGEREEKDKASAMQPMWALFPHLNPNNVATNLSDSKLPLHVCAEDGHSQAAKLLLCINADVNKVNENGCTPLHLAASKGHCITADLLIRNGASVEAKSTRRGGEAFLRAGEAFCWHERTFWRFFGYNACKPSVRGAKGFISGETPLHFAASEGHKNAAKLLIEKQANVMAKAEIGYDVSSFSGHIEVTPLHLAASKGHKDTVELLIENKAAVNISAGFVREGSWSFGGITPLHLAASAGHCKTVELLVQNGAYVNTNASVTPLLLARMEGHRETANLLERNGAKESWLEKM